MKNTQVCNRILSAVLVLVLLFAAGSVRNRVLAAEQEKTVPAAAPAEAPAAPAPAEPEETLPQPDPESAAFQRCALVAETVDAAQILVYDADRDQILYKKTSGTDKLYPASTTKLFTAWVALQYLKPSDVITASDELDLVRKGSSMAFIYRDQSVTAEMLVEAMMLPSGNDAAHITAAAAGRAIAKNPDLPAEEAVREFVREMNRQAEKLGFTHSHFMDPDGFHVGAHYTCLDDMVRIAELALANPVIRKYMAISGDEVEYVSGQTNTWHNTNKLLDPESPFYDPHAVGMKTGYTSQAGFCLMSAFQIGGRTIVVGVFGCRAGDNRFTDVIDLLNAALG